MEGNDGSGGAAASTAPTQFIGDGKVTVSSPAKGAAEDRSVDQMSAGRGEDPADTNENITADCLVVSLDGDQPGSHEPKIPVDENSHPVQHSTESAVSDDEGQRGNVMKPEEEDQLPSQGSAQGHASPLPQGSLNEDRNNASIDSNCCKVPSALSQSSEQPPSDQGSQAGGLPLSPVSGSTSGQDSGVSPDDSSSENLAKSPTDILTLKGGEDAFSPDESKQNSCALSSPESVHAGQPQSLSKSHTEVLSDTNTSASETQVTVSDLDSPPGEGAMCTPAQAAAAAASTTSSDQESVYYVKWITFGQNSVPIITQNENGPCPLLAIMNVLLLKGKVKLAPVLEMVTSEQLMTYLGDCIFENMPQNLPEPTKANYEQNMQDAMGVMYKLQTGLDVNVRFTGVRDFEYTPELIIFDLLEILLYHGWLVDPQDADTVKAVNQCSYNQLVEKIISLKHSEAEENVTQALIAEQFLERTASQLTYHGLCELSSVVKEKELCVFFRNNHFNTLYKHNNELFLLVTDQGFLTESNVVWETLSNVDGDGHFTDASFRTYTKPAPSTDPIPEPGVPVGSPEQIDHDYQVALYLQEEASAQNPAWATGGYQQDQAAVAQTDHEFAKLLQEEENRRAMLEQQRATAAAAQPAPHHQGQGRYQGHGVPQEGQRRRGDRGERREKDEKSCSIL